MRTRHVNAIRLSAGTWALLAVAAGVSAAGLQVKKGEVTVVCPMTVGGSFQAKTAAISGELTPGAAGAIDGAITVDLRTLDTGIELRNRHLREKYLEVEKGEGFAQAKISAIHLETADPGAFDGKAAFKGTFQLHGQSKEVSGTAEVHKNGEARTVVASFPLSVSDFAIPKPSYLGVGVKNEIEVKVSFEAAPGGAAAPAAAGSK